MTDLFDMAVAAKLAGGSGGGEAVLKTKTVTANGVYNASSDHADGYSKVTVNVPSPPAPVLVTKNIGANGTYAASGDNADGYSAVTVEVPAPEPPVLTTKSITENGTYTAAGDNADGYSAVTVAVPTPAPPVLISKSVTANGTYTAASDSADGYSSVTVAVPASSPYVDDALAETYSAVGTKKVITTSEWITFPAQGTYEACFKYTSVDSPNGRIFHLGNSTHNMLVLDIQTNSVPEIGVSDTWTGEGGRSAVQTLLSADTFYTVALTVDCTNNVVKMFVNGVEAETIDVPCSSLSSQVWDVTYLFKSDTAYRNAYGDLYSYRRHTRLLTAAEILQNHQTDLQKYGQNV